MRAGQVISPDVGERTGQVISPDVSEQVISPERAAQVWAGHFSCRDVGIGGLAGQVISPDVGERAGWAGHFS